MLCWCVFGIGRVLLFIEERGQVEETTWARYFLQRSKFCTRIGRETA